LEGEVVATQGDRGRQCATAIASTTRRRRNGFVDRLRERGQSSARTRQRERAGNGRSPGAWRRAGAIDASVVNGKLGSFAARRTNRPNDSFSNEGFSGAPHAGKSAAAQ